GLADELAALVRAALARELYHSLDVSRSRQARQLARDAATLARESGSPWTLARCLIAAHDVCWRPGSARAPLPVLPQRPAPAPPPPARRRPARPGPGAAPPRLPGARRPRRQRRAGPVLQGIGAAGGRRRPMGRPIPPRRGRAAGRPAGGSGHADRRRRS